MIDFKKRIRCEHCGQFTKRGLLNQIEHFHKCEASKKASHEAFQNAVGEYPGVLTGEAFHRAVEEYKKILRSNDDEEERIHRINQFRSGRL